ncbi:MAG: sarcosine oxidase subunit delta [Planctomycetales bacterium]
MKIINCPVNGPRPIQEFHFGGQVRDMPEPDTATDQQWADYIFNRDGEPGTKCEWWYHVPSGIWFVAERDYLTDEFIKTYLYETPATDG